MRLLYHWLYALSGRPLTRRGTKPSRFDAIAAKLVTPRSVPTQIALLSQDWPPTAAKEGENEHGAARRAMLVLSFWGGAGNTFDNFCQAFALHAMFNPQYVLCYGEKDSS